MGRSSLSAKPLDMASVFTHPIPAVALAAALGSRVMPPRLTAAAVIASLLPDLDVVSFSFGVKYAEALGHRGFSHSLFFALIASFVAFAAAPLLKSRRSVAFAVILFSVCSHILLDAMTTGGLGVAFLWPFDATRHFLPWRPIVVSPFSASRFFSDWGLRVIVSELRYVWAPCAMVAISLMTVRKILANTGRTSIVSRGDKRF